MYNLIQVYTSDKIKLMNNIRHLRNSIDFYLISNDHLNANKLEREIKYLINKFNIEYCVSFKE